MDIAQSSIIVVQCLLRTASYCMLCCSNGPLFALSSTQLQKWISKTLKSYEISKGCHRVRSSLKPNRLHSYRHEGRPAVKIFVGYPGDVHISPPPGSLGFRAIVAARIFWGISLGSPRPKLRGGGVHQFLLIVRYFWFLWLSQELLLAILIISHCSEPAETNYQVQLIVVLGCVDIGTSVVFTVLVNLTNALA